MNLAGCHATRHLATEYGSITHHTIPGIGIGSLVLVGGMTIYQPGNMLQTPALHKWAAVADHLLSANASNNIEEVIRQPASR